MYIVWTTNALRFAIQFSCCCVVLSHLLLYLLFRQAALRGNRQLPGSEWNCVEVDVESFSDKLGIPVPFCDFLEGLVDVDRSFKTTFKSCCEKPSGDATPECCRCNRQLEDDRSTRFFFFKSLNGKNECPAIWPGNPENPNELVFQTAVEAAPGQNMDDITALLEGVP